ncbi:hypothetical protein E4U43_000547 [Claviceps pusilla]|uniref:Uncharacterized protein n=1 Tax=Claviceps pusilla TaxID=123648 RepID=A0A9P7T028_9HYPO|nr:hypothetical protein E4U43_000547 [Claviceps pusilla]
MAEDEAPQPWLECRRRLRCGFWTYLSRQTGTANTGLKPNYAVLAVANSDVTFRYCTVRTVLAE